MARAEVVITLTPGEQRRGLWCERCQLPSRIEQYFYSLSKFGVSTLTAATCADHGRDDG